MGGPRKVARGTPERQARGTARAYTWRPETLYSIRGLPTPVLKCVTVDGSSEGEVGSPCAHSEGFGC